MKGLFKKAISRMSPTCQDMSRLCSQSLDRKLTIRERISMCIHCWICSWCVDYSDQVQKVSDTVRDEGETLAELKEEKLSDECKARMRAILNESESEEDQRN